MVVTEQHKKSYILSTIYTRMITNKAVQRGISFPPDLLERIDTIRGREDRSRFVCRMLEKALKGEKE